MKAPKTCACSMIVAVTVGCSPTTPSSTGPLVIVPDTSVAKTGDRLALSATVGSRQSVTAKWTSDNDNVAVVDSTSGTVTALKSGAVTISATALGLSATRPLRVVANLNGKWAGQAVIRDCRSSGIGFPCRGTVGGTRALELQIQQTQERFVGTLALFDPIAGSATGRIDPNGSLALSATLKADEIDEVSLTDWTGRIDEPSATINGSFVLTLRFTSFFGQQFIAYTCDFTAPRASF